MRPAILVFALALTACPTGPVPATPATPAPSIAAPVAAPAASAPRDELATFGADGLASIQADELSSGIRFLADDLLEGRGTGERGFDVAAHYVASTLQAAGIAPAGDGGTYLQRVPLVAMTNVPAATRVVLSKGRAQLRLKDTVDVMMYPPADREKVDATAPLVFVGYGITAPEYHYDDLAGVDLKGKIAVILRGGPLSDRDDFFPPTMSAYYGDFDNKVAHLRELGAIGVLSVMRPEDEARYSWSFIVGQNMFESMDWLEGDHGGSPDAPVRGSLPGVTFTKILAFVKSPETLASLVKKANEGKSRPFDLGVTATVHHESHLRRLSSSNVVGVLRGSDPSLAGEHVVYTAHLDHLGKGAPVDGDAIYNGADDDASGTATVLAIARAFAALPIRPKRSMLFLLTTGEEKGLLGAEYFAHHPTVPTASIVADVNIDGNSPAHEVHDVVPLGAEHSSLMRASAAAAAAFGLAVSPDPDPTFAAFIRSDQYAFVKRGVPSVFICEGMKDAKGSTDANLAIDKARMEKRYHSPKDEWDPSLDYGQLVKMARVDFLLGLAIANDAERPKWNRGDFFERFVR